MRCDNSKKAILLIKKILALFVVFFSIFIFLFSTYWFNSKKASIVNENNAHFNTTNIKSETLSENKSNMFHFVGEYYFNTEDTPLIISGTSSDTDTTVTSSEIKFWYYVIECDIDLIAFDNRITIGDSNNVSSTDDNVLSLQECADIGVISNLKWYVHSGRIAPVGIEGKFTAKPSFSRNVLHFANDYILYKEYNHSRSVDNSIVNPINTNRPNPDASETLTSPDDALLGFKVDNIFSGLEGYISTEGTGINSIKKFHIRINPTISISNTPWINAVFFVPISGQVAYNVFKVADDLSTNASLHYWANEKNIINMSLPNLSATGVFNISYLIAIDGNHTFKNPNTWPSNSTPHAGYSNMLWKINSDYIVSSLLAWDIVCNQLSDNWRNDPVLAGYIDSSLSVNEINALDAAIRSGKLLNFSLSKVLATSNHNAFSIPYSVADDGVLSGNKNIFSSFSSSESYALISFLINNIKKSENDFIAALNNLSPLPWFTNSTSIFNIPVNDISYDQVYKKINLPNLVFDLLNQYDDSGNKKIYTFNFFDMRYNGNLVTASLNQLIMAINPSIAETEYLLTTAVFIYDKSVVSGFNIDLFYSTPASDVKPTARRLGTLYYDATKTYSFVDFTLLDIGGTPSLWDRTAVQTYNVTPQLLTPNKVLTTLPYSVDNNDQRLFSVNNYTGINSDVSSPMTDAQYNEYLNYLYALTNNDIDFQYSFINFWSNNWYDGITRNNNIAIPESKNGARDGSFIRLDLSMFITIDPFFASDVFKMTLIPNSSNIDTCRFVTKNGAGDGGVGGNTQIKFESASNPNTNLPELKIYVPTYFTRTNNIPDDTPLVITLQNLAEKINVDVDDFQNNQNLLNLQISPYIVASNVELFSSYLIRSYDENFTQSPYANIYIDIPRNYLDQILLTVLSGNFKQITLNVKTDNAGNAIGLLYSLIIPPTLSYFNPMFTVNNPNFQNITYTCDSNLQPNGIINFLSYVPPSPAPDPSPPVPMENIAPIIGLILGGIIVVGILLFVISARIKKNKIMREESEDSDNEKKVKTLKGNE